jgi:hypothetical protein
VSLKWGERFAPSIFFKEKRMRVIVEDSLFELERFPKLAKLLNGCKHEALGLLVTLWHESQAEFVVECSKERIINFMSVDLDNEKEEEKYFQALVESEFLRKGFDGYRISGNKERLHSLVQECEGFDAYRSSNMPEVECEQ